MNRLLLLTAAQTRTVTEADNRAVPLVPEARRLSETRGLFVVCHKKRNRREKIILSWLESLQEQAESAV